MRTIPFCERPIEEKMGVLESLTHHIIHDHNHEAGKHIRNHSGHCQSLMHRLAIAMGICDEKELAVIMEGSYYHDIGKIWINPSIVAKRGILDERETDIMRMHVHWRSVATIMETMIGSSFVSLRDITRDFICGHQQKTKDSGYPEHNEYPFRSYDLLNAMRIIDEFQAGFCKERSWRTPKDYEEMKKDLRERAEQGFLDQRIVDLFTNLPVADTFHDENFRPIIQTNIIDNVGIIGPEVYDRLTDFKMK